MKIFSSSQKSFASLCNLEFRILPKFNFHTSAASILLPSKVSKIWTMANIRLNKEKLLQKLRKLNCDHNRKIIFEGKWHDKGQKLKHWLVCRQVHLSTVQIKNIILNYWKQFCKINQTFLRLPIFVSQYKDKLVWFTLQKIVSPAL